MAESLSDRPQGCTCFRLRRASRRMTQLYDAHLAPCGLTLTQYSLLANLQRLQSPGVHDLAEAMGMDRTSLTRTLKPLMEQGLIAVASAPDRRRKRLTLTAAGEARRWAARPLWRAAQDAIEQLLGPETVAELHRLLDMGYQRLAPDEQA